MQKGDLFARILGVVVSLVGVAVLIITFMQAFRLFTSPGELLIPSVAEPDGGTVAPALGLSALMLLFRIGLLFIMALIGSLVASKGIQLYFGGEPIIKENKD